MKNVVLFVLLILTLGAYSQPGELDSTFGAKGVATYFPEGGAASVVSLDGNQRIVLAGGTASFSFTLVRFSSDGKVDSTFGTSGFAEFEVGGGSNFVQGMAIQNDGKILVGGKGLDYDGKWCYLIARFNSDGSIDHSFGENGEVITSFNSSYNGDSGWQIAVQTDGKIVQVGHAEDDFGVDGFGIVRLNTDGSLDNTFDGDGKSFTTFGVEGHFGTSVKIQADGKIVAGGTYSTTGLQSSFAVARYNLDGSLDQSFGNGGKVTTYFGDGQYGDDDEGLDLVIQPDGKIVMTGQSYFLYSDTPSGIPLVRYNADGSLDSSFGIGGKVLAYYPREDVFWTKAIELQPDGKLLVAGTIIPDTFKYHMVLARFNPNGSKDYSFGDSGLIVISFDSTDNYGNDAAMHQDGKILLAGKSGYGFTVARFLSGLSIGLLELGSFDNPLLIYPNPMRSDAVLEYSLNKAETISVHLLDLQGRVIQTFIQHEYQDVGKHQQRIQIPESLPSGSYLLMISNLVGGKQTIKIVKY